MPEYINPERLELSDDFFKVAVLDEVKKYVTNEIVIAEWQDYVMDEVNSSQTVQKNNSFNMLCELVRVKLGELKLTKENIRLTFEGHHQEILEEVLDSIVIELPVTEHVSVNESTTDLAKDERYLVSSMDYQFHLVRNIVTKPKSFTPNEESDVLQAEIKDSKGKVRGLARLNVSQNTDVAMAEDEQKYWNKLRSAFNSMDEMTADIFDIICFLYLFAPKDQDGFIYFHSNDALKLRSNVIESKKNSFEVRQRDRFNIMSRVKALSNIWVSLKEGEIIEVDNESDLKNEKRYKYRDWQRLFDIGKVRAAYDEEDHFVGIYACQVKPTSLLTSFLNENKRLGIIDLSTLEFHPIRQRAEKRLARYLSIQWFIRSSKNNLRQAFTVRTLLHEMDLGERIRGPELYDRFIKALNRLNEKGFVDKWEFTEEIDYSKLGTRKWLPYFYGLKVMITPSREIIEKNKRKLSILQSKTNPTTISNLIESLNHTGVEAQQPKQVQLTTTQAVSQSRNVQLSFQELDNQAGVEITTDTLTPEMVIKERERRNLSITKAAKEIGIGYNTLKRYENRLTKRRNQNNDEKIVNWLNISLMEF